VFEFVIQSPESTEFSFEASEDIELIFGKLVSFFHGFPIVIQSDNYSNILTFSNELGINGLKKKCLQYYKPSQISFDNAFDYLLNLSPNYAISIYNICININAKKFLKFQLISSKSF
jgi:hypothetical protein